jgi:uncharacterized protein YlbG (UPF0298 family)
MEQQRIGYIVWVNDVKAGRNLERFGNVHYISKKLKYVVIYVDFAKSSEFVDRMTRLPYVKKVELSLRGEIPTEYSSSSRDKSKAFSS